MPGDSLSNQQTPIDKKNYDAIVIGTGMSGGWAMKELTEQGLTVLAIERGRNLQHIKDYDTATLNPWDKPHRGGLTKAFIDTNPILVRAGVMDEFTDKMFLGDKAHPYVQDQPFDWIRGYQLGGRSLLWGRWTQRWGEGDFEANAKEGIGTDWPIRYKDLAPWSVMLRNLWGLLVTGTDLHKFRMVNFFRPLI